MRLIVNQLTLLFPNFYPYTVIVHSFMHVATCNIPLVPFHILLDVLKYCVFSAS
jgi:hypothetical protein